MSQNVFHFEEMTAVLISYTNVHYFVIIDEFLSSVVDRCIVPIVMVWYGTFDYLSGGERKRHLSV